MTITEPRPQSKTLTYEQYIAEGEVEGRYDILDGVRTPMPGATWPHQKTAFQVAKALDRYQEANGNGQVIMAPLDVLIRRNPLRTRQPDVLYISNAQLARGGGIPETGCLEVAPELIVEVISDSETERSIGAKLADYIAIGVLEGWLVRRAARAIDVVRLAPDGPLIAATYNDTQTLQSLTFPDLHVAVADIFRI